MAALIYFDVFATAWRLPKAGFAKYNLRNLVVNDASRKRGTYIKEPLDHDDRTFLGSLAQATFRHLRVQKEDAHSKASGGSRFAASAGSTGAERAQGFRLGGCLTFRGGRGRAGPVMAADASVGAASGFVCFLGGDSGAAACCRCCAWVIMASLSRVEASWKLNVQRWLTCC